MRLMASRAQHDSPSVDDPQIDGSTTDESTNEGDGRQTVNLVGAAEITGVTAATIRYWILTNALPATKIGGQWSINIEDLKRVDQEKLDIGWGQRGKRGRIVSTPQ